MQYTKHPVEPEIDFSLEGFSTADILQDRAIAMRKRRKRVRTKAALIAAAASELEKTGFDSLTVEGISDAAGMARGTFYLYYRKRSDIAAAVMKFYWALLRIHRPKGGARLDLRESIHRMNNFSARVAMKNARLLSGRETLMLENPYLARRFEAINHTWAGRVVRDVMARGIATPVNNTPDFLHLKARAVINMSDALLRDIYRGFDLRADVPSVDPDLVVRVMDDLWFRALYMEAPEQ
jgi:AcrR family transcriptional regulator